MEEHAATAPPGDDAVREETEQLADGRTIRFFAWVEDPV